MSSALESKLADPLTDFGDSLKRVHAYLDRLSRLNALYRAGDIHAHVPDALHEDGGTLDEVVGQYLPASHSALQAASQGLFFSLPVAFDPSESVGPYLAAVDRDAAGQPYRFLDMGAQIATHAFGENDPDTVRAVLESLPFAVDRYAHSEYQTVLSLRLKAALNAVAPAGTPRHFIVNTGAEAVENAIKAALMNRVMTTEDRDGGFVVSFEGAFHGRTLGCLAVTHRKKARLGFPTFDWPHIPFPSDEPRSPKETLAARRPVVEAAVGSAGLGTAAESGEEQGHVPARDRRDRRVPGQGGYERRPPPAVNAFIDAQRAELTPDVVKRAKKVAAVLVEPVQGEGGVRMASARFMRKLRLLTRIYDVPLIFDEVQSGWGMTGKLWAHEHFDLPCPPDVVTWAKKAQNGVLFVSEELATFFQEEKKFNTTWEGDSAGMVRLLAKIDKLDLEQVRPHRRARQGGARSAGAGASRDHPARPRRRRDARLRRRPARLERSAARPRIPARSAAARRPASGRVRFYPRYDTEPSAIDEALSILRSAIEDLVGGRLVSDATPALRIRVGTLTIPVDTLEIVDLTPDTFEANKAQILQLEQERFDPESPLLKYPPDTLEATLKNPRAIGIGVRDRVSGRLVGYALGSAIEDHDEEGISSDPRVGENDTFYLQALVVPPSVQNAVELENFLLDTLRRRAIEVGFEYLSTLIESRVCETAPDWFKAGATLETLDNYLGSGATFDYLPGAAQIR